MLKHSQHISISTVSISTLANMLHDAVASGVQEYGRTKSLTASSNFLQVLFVDLFWARHIRIRQRQRSQKRGLAICSPDRDGCIKAVSCLSLYFRLSMAHTTKLARTLGKWQADLPSLTGMSGSIVCPPMLLLWSLPVQSFRGGAHRAYPQKLASVHSLEGRSL